MAGAAEVDDDLLDEDEDDISDIHLNEVSDVSPNSSATSIEYDPKRTVGGTSQIPATEAITHNTTDVEGAA